MKKKILVLALLIGTLGAYAQKGVDDGSRWGKGQDSIRSITNYSLFSESAKHKNYADALAPWESCFADCPLSSVNLYVYGVQIVNWQYSTATSEADKQKYFEKLMAVYDQRIKYFGTDARHPEGYVLGLKGMSHMQYRPDDLDDIYATFGKSITLMGEKTDPRVLLYYMDYTIKMHTANKLDDATVMANYDKVSALTAKTDDGKKLQDDIDKMFVESGVANCTTLTKMFNAQLDSNKTNVQWMAKAIAFMSRAGCDQSDLYMQILELQNKMDPSAESSWKMGQRYYNKNDFKKAMTFFEEAASKCADPVQKAKYFYQMAQVAYSTEKSYPKAREYCNKAIQANAAYGAPYLLIAQMYAGSATKGDLGKKEMQNRAGYWAAYDMAAKAKNADSSEDNVKIAASLMSQYKAQFPTVETVFMDPDYTAGKTVTVGGWINVQTVVRTK